MYTVKIRNSIMIAHSLPNPYFGPASKMHGATYVIDAVFYRKDLNEYNVVIDIGEAHSILGEVLEKLNYQNLDEIGEFQGKLTTTEFLAKHIHGEVRKRVTEPIEALEIILGESHVAWASYKS